MQTMQLSTGARGVERSPGTVPRNGKQGDRSGPIWTENLFYGPPAFRRSKPNGDHGDRKEKDLGLTRETVERNTSHTSAHTSQNQLYGRNTCQKTVPTVPRTGVIHNHDGIR